LFLYSFLFLFNGISVYIAVDQYHQVKRKIEILRVLRDQYQAGTAESLDADELADDELEYPEIASQDTTAVIALDQRDLAIENQENVEIAIVGLQSDDDFEFLSADEEKILAQAKQELAEYRKKIAAERVRRQSQPQQKKQQQPRAKKSTTIKKSAAHSTRKVSDSKTSDGGRIKIPSMAYVKKRAVTNSFFDWPIDLSRCWLSSPYGMRKHPRGGKKFHAGIDLAAMRGTPVMAAASGVVAQAEYVTGYGNNIMLNHSNAFKTRYAHLHKIYVKVGQTVEQGQKIGAVGATGYVRKSGRDGSHLHFEIYSGGHHVNPLKYLLNE
jgi:murein DD-endopeptidase MepM/ murein hydrolase activator NlpD